MDVQCSGPKYCNMYIIFWILNFTPIWTWSQIVSYVYTTIGKNGSVGFKFFLNAQFLYLKKSVWQVKSVLGYEGEYLSINRFFFPFPTVHGNESKFW